MTFSQFVSVLMILTAICVCTWFVMYSIDAQHDQTEEKVLKSIAKHDIVCAAKLDILRAELKKHDNKKAWGQR